MRVLSGYEGNVHRRALDIVIDYEHQTLEDVQAPLAVGLRNSSSRIMPSLGRWNGHQAEEYLKKRNTATYPRLLLVRKSDQKAVVLHSVAPTNTPAIDGMFPIINSLDITQYEGGNNMDFLKQLAALLGLGEESYRRASPAKASGVTS
ncbi:phage protease [Paenibacillus melissococcoides]|uniref:phage protease n=1 Tax=Paenibacillus melissococcoides TaxID=2912268 RepID=UPI0021C2A45A|nr:phage protease [Paenibacillus melissococcoides]CAH8721011.1 phage protease [Paenibacillus melissococcoides]CAH8721022.1 phage protease [Paenibacillus melissococcoides]